MMNDNLFERAVGTYRAALPAGQLIEFALTGADRLDVPCYSAVFTPENGSPKGGVGYGETLAQAMCGAFGELTEDFRAHESLKSWPRVMGSYDSLVSERGSRGVIDPLTLCLEAGCAYSSDLQLEWVEIARFGTDERVLVPIEFVACDFGDLEPVGNPRLGVKRRERLVTPITNGLGAGLEWEQAVSHGILELLQRDSNGLSIRALATGVALDVRTVSDPISRELLEKFDAASVDVVVKIASTERDLTSFYVCGLDREEHGASAVMALAGGEAIHPDATVALRKALLEFASSRARIAFFHGPLEIAERIAPPGYLEGYRAKFRAENEEARALQSMVSWSRLSTDEVRKRLLARVQRVDSRVSFESLPSREIAGGKAGMLQSLVELLYAEGLEVLVADFSDSASGAPTVKVIVPGLEVETLSYGRIGARNLSRLRQMASDGGPKLVGMGKAVGDSCSVLLTDEARITFGDAWFDEGAVAEIMNPLYSLYREPTRHAVAFVADVNAESD